jgi:exopolyphosphatase/guanosine-5'-triphosphate,3'-diphosphate pyrophosphatase
MAPTLFGDTARWAPVAPTPVAQRAGKTLGLHGLHAAVPTTTYAAIDLGSSSAKMLVLEKTASGFRMVVDLKIGCALGKGVDNGADIPAGNQERAVAALQQLVGVAKEHGVDVGSIPLVTTAVVRNATNGADFVARVAREVGLAARVLSGDEEADLGYRGALGTLLDTPGLYASLDLGGGSFQLAVGTEQGLTGGGSTQVGSNFILDTLINPHVDADGRIPAAVLTSIDLELARTAPLPLPAEQLAGRTLLATGGVSKFLRVQVGSDVVTRDEIVALRSQLAALSIPERSAFVQHGKSDAEKEALGIGTRDGAADYGKKLPASMSLLLRILDGLSVTEVRVSSTDARHALVIAQAN